MKRAEAAQICQSVKFILENSDYTEAVEEALDMAIEALEQEGIIRCGDCKHYREYEPDADYDGWCSLDRVTDVNKEDFCSRAERKER